VDCGPKFFWISNASAKARRKENFEFLDSLERYFTYFKTRFEEKLQPPKGIFKSPEVVRSKKYLFKTLSTCKLKYNSKIARCLRF
jgi:hypothetical protein